MSRLFSAMHCSFIGWMDLFQIIDSSVSMTDSVEPVECEEEQVGPELGSSGFTVPVLFQLQAIQVRIR